MRIHVPGLLLLTAALTAACASGQRGDREFYSRDILTSEQIRSTGAVDANEAVARLKSHWLRSVTPTSPGNQETRSSPVMAYLDNQRLGGVDQLRRVEVAAIEYIQYFPPAEAAARWGFGNSGGAILVSTQPLER